VIVTFPPERVMSALAPLAEPAPPTQPQRETAPEPPPDRNKLRLRPLFRLGS
jgi:two-component system cell cycle sensor histidine kinase PleC